jgi:hypothetical protein
MVMAHRWNPSAVLGRRERGVAVVDALLMLTAPVLVASVFGLAVTNTGRLSTDAFQHVADSALRQTGSGVMLDSTVLGRTDGHSLTEVLVQVRIMPGGQAVDLGSSAGDAKTIISYIDGGTVARDVPYGVHWIAGNGDSLLEAGEVAELAVDISALTPVGDSFTLEVRPPGALPVSVRCPRPTAGSLDAVIPPGRLTVGVLHAP